MSNEITTPNESTLTLNQAQLEIFTQTTPKDEIRVRQGKGGRNLLYTDSAYVIRTLNSAFNWNWDYISDQAEILYVGDRPFEVKCRGLLTVRIGGRAITKTQYGCQPIEMLKDGSAPVSLGDAFKGAATDALKKCASLLGIALDLYDSDSETVTGRVKPQTEAKPPVVIEQPKGKTARPMTPEQVKAATFAKTKYIFTTPPAEKQATYAFSSISKACEGDEDARHAVVAYLFDVASMKDLTGGQCSFLIDWIGATADNDYTANPDAVKEIGLIVIQRQKDLGQVDMFENEIPQ